MKYSEMEDPLCVVVPFGAQPLSMPRRFAHAGAAPIRLEGCAMTYGCWSTAAREPLAHRSLGI